MKDIGTHLRNSAYALRLVYRISPLTSIISLLLTIIQGVLPLAILYFTKLVIDVLSNLLQAGADVVAGGGIFSANFRLLWIYIGLAASAAVLTSIIDSILNYLTGRQGMLLKERMIAEIQQCSIEAELALYESAAYHNNIYLAQRDAPHQPLKIASAFVQIIQSLISLTAVSILLASFHWSLLLIAPFVALLPFIASKFLSSKRNVMLEKENANLERRCSYLHYVITSLTHAAEVRMMRFGGVIIKWHNELMRKLHQKKLQLIFATSIMEQASHISALLVMYLCFAVMAWKTILKAITLGDLVMYIQAFMRVQSALQAIITSAASLYEGSLYLQAYRNLLELKPHFAAQKTDASIKVPEKISHGIMLKDVSFAYTYNDREDSMILKQISLNIPANKITAFYGPNGSGKSTCARLICRLYEIKAGSIFLEEQPLQNYSLDSVRSSIAVLFQDFGKYHMTALENIWIGKNEIAKDDERIKTAAKNALIDEVICKLPDGYNTPLCNWLWDGSELSMGEWQKLSLARMLLKESPIWILDEPGAFLDEAGKDALLSLCKANKEGRCIIIISHSKEIALQADHLCLFKDGTLVAEGTPSQLEDKIGKNGN
jgi:ATP-binding cassette subfamily B protein